MFIPIWVLIVSFSIVTLLALKTLQHGYKIGVEDGIDTEEKQNKKAAYDDGYYFGYRDALHVND